MTRYCIWYTRNVVKYDRKNFDMTILFKIIVKERLQVEFFMYKQLKQNIYDFETLWARNNALCYVTDSLLIHVL